MLRNVFLDLDDTIFDFHKAERIALEKTLRELGIEPTPAVMDRYSEINRRQWQLLELGELTRDQVKTRRYRLLFDEIGADADEREAARIYGGYLAVGHWFLPGAEEMLRALRGRYRLYLITNGNTSVQKGRLASSGIAPLFEDIFISEEIGFDKPSRQYFEACFSRISGFSREESAVVGDSLTSDIRGGINAGVRTVWLCPEGKEPRDMMGIVPDFRIRRPDELPALLVSLDEGEGV